MLSAVFATPAVTAVVGAITWLAAFGFGLVAADGNVPASTSGWGSWQWSGSRTVAAATETYAADRDHHTRHNSPPPTPTKVRRQANTD